MKFWRINFFLQIKHFTQSLTHSKWQKMLTLGAQLTNPIINDITRMQPTRSRIWKVLIDKQFNFFSKYFARENREQRNYTLKKKKKHINQMLGFVLIQIQTKQPFKNCFYNYIWWWMLTRLTWWPFHNIYQYQIIMLYTCQDGYHQ